MTPDEALARIRARARPEQLAGMARYGLGGRGRLGLSVPDMRAIAKMLGRDHALADALWRTGIPDAQIVAAFIADPARLTDRQMDRWVKGIEAWDVCDQVCTSLFDRSPLAWKKVRDWAEREGEFVRRAAFATIAGLAWHDENAADRRFLALLPLIERVADDERNYVRKAVSWALRHIGKRNLALHDAAVQTAARLRRRAGPEGKTARWIGADAVRDLESEATRRRLAGRSVSRDASSRRLTRP